MGTEIKSGDELLWADILRMVNPFNSDSFLDVLGFGDNLESLHQNLEVSNVIGKKVTFDYSAGLISQLKEAGYTDSEIFTFPYDWRYGVTGVYADGKTNVSLLQQKISEIITQTGSEKVDVVAHSTGGLLVKKYIIDNADHHVGKLVFVGVPNTGAPKAIKALVLGDNFDIPGLSQEEIKKISQNMPVVYDLAPSREYEKNKGSFLTINDRNLTSQTSTNLNYSQTTDYLTKNYALNAQAFNNADNLHTSAYDNFDLRTAGVDFYNIVGCKRGTYGRMIQNIRHWEDGSENVLYPEPEWIAGDGTVPLESSTNVPVDENHRYFSYKATHSQMLSQSGIRQQIVKLVSGDNMISVDPKQISTDISLCGLNGRSMAIYSPVSMSITDQDGNVAEIASDNSIQNNIPNADYEIANDHSFIYLPNDDGQNYTMHLIGTGNGVFTFKLTDIANSARMGSQVFFEIPVTASTTGNLTINTQGDAAMDLDDNGDGIMDRHILPTARLTAEESWDFTPPNTEISLSGNRLENGNYLSSVSVSLIATDTPAFVSNSISGVNYIKYCLDENSCQIYNSPLVVSNVGSHSIKYYAMDRAGNKESEQNFSFSIQIPEEKNSNSTGGAVPVPNSIFVTSGQVLGIATTVPESRLIHYNGTIYVMEKSGLHPFSSDQEFFSYELNFNQVSAATEGEMKNLSASRVIAKPGTLVKNNFDKTVYMVGADKLLHGFTNEQSFLANGFNFNSVRVFNLAGYKIGENINGIIMANDKLLIPEAFNTAQQFWYQDI